MSRDKCNLDAISFQEALKYKEYWSELKERIRNLQDTYKVGDMLSANESIHGENVCNIILEEMIDIVNSGEISLRKCKYRIKSRDYRNCNMCDFKNICKFVDDRPASEKIDDFKHARKS